MSVTDRSRIAARLVPAGNRALEGTFVSPVTRRPLARAGAGPVLVTDDGVERFPILAGDVPDLRPEAEAFWAGTREHKLLLPTGPDGVPFWYPRA
ncbi:MAG: hypothetical protein ACRDLA_06700, partial [Thermoleophilaceae bacterium]